MSSQDVVAAARAATGDLLRIVEHELIPTIHIGELDAILSRVAQFYGYETGPVPAVIKINPRTGKLTDMLLVKENEQYVATVGIGNVFSGECLRNVYHSGPNGRFAVHEVLRLIARNLSARACATSFQGWQVQLDDHVLPAFSDLAGALMRPHWRNPQDLREARTRLTEVGVFSVSTFDTRMGTLLTSDTEQPDMGGRAWLTDATEQRHNQWSAPQQWPMWRRSLVLLAASVATQKNMDRCMSAINDLRWYRYGPIVNGLPHVIQMLGIRDPNGGVKWDETNQVPDRGSEFEDPGWGNRRRLHSLAETLRELCRTLLAGALWGSTNELGAPWGFVWDEKHAAAFPPHVDRTPLNEPAKQIVIQAIQVLAPFLMAIEWNGREYDFQAPSCSDWEETDIGPAARDIGAMLDAFNLLEELLNNPAHDSHPIIADIRRRLHNVELHGWAGSLDRFLHGHHYADFRRPHELGMFRASCLQVFGRMVVHPAAQSVAGMLNAPPTGVSQFDMRRADTSLCLMAANQERFDWNPARNGAIRYGVVKWCESELMEPDLENRLGMRRYGIFTGPRGQKIFDSYLGFMWDVTTAIPRLAVPLFRQFVDPWFHQVAPHLESRRAAASLTDWDILIERAWKTANDPFRQVKDHPNTDATTLDAMAGRQILTLPPWSAQWTLGVAAGLVGVALAQLSLLQRLRDTGMDRPVLDRFRRAKRLGDRFLNLLIRTIVQNTDADGKQVLRANGEPFKARYNIMEAFQVVPSLDGRIIWMPGQHTLLWTGSLFKRGLDLQIQAADIAQSLKL